jgi:4-cresol dehydrogenase (hydroxylating)
MPAIGPDLAQLFIQSNFGIVTSIRIPLFPIPEVTETFTIAFKTDDDFFNGLEILTALRKDGTIASLAHTGNATRALMTSSRFPKEFNPSHVISEVECQTYLNKNSPIEFGAWSCVGGLYGYKDDVKNKKSRMKKAFKGKANVKFFSDSKMNRLDSLLNSKLALKFKKLDFIRGSFSSLKALHGIIRGQPSNHPSQNILWRVNDVQNLGLIWHAPVVPATKEDCTLFLDSCREVYAEYGFEMPMTLTLINAKYMTSVLNISFDKSNPEETARAHEAYKALTKVTNELGYFPYRCGIASDASAYYSEGQQALLKKIKSALDPQNTIAPGRYAIGGGAQ